MANLFELSPRDFNAYIAEQSSFGRSPQELDDLRRRYRDANSVAGKLKGLLSPEEGKRRSTFLPVDAPEGMSIWDALTSGQASPAIPQGIVDMLVGGSRGVESLKEYYQGVPPAADMTGDAFLTASTGFLGGGAAARPSGSMGANTFRRKSGPTFEEAPMVVQHNISPEGLAISDRVGGIPMPSIGIAGAKAPLENFGDITLILKPEKIEPRRDLPVYPADAYTGRQPRAFMDFIDESQVRKNFREDPRFKHIGSSWLDSYSPDDADHAMRIVERGIEEKLIDPKDFDDFRKMYREASAKLGPDAYDDEVIGRMTGISRYGDMQLSIAPDDWYTPSGNRRKPKPYTAEEAYKRMNKEKAFQAGAEQHSGPGLLRAVLLDKFKSLDDIKANRGLLRPSGNDMQDIKGAWDTVSYDAINDIAERYFDGNHRKSEGYITDLAMGKSVSWANAPDGTRKAAEKTLAKLKKEVKGMPTEYFEAKPRSVAQIGDFDAAIVPSGRESVVDMLRAAGVKDIRLYDDAIPGQTRRDVIGGMDDYFFSNASKSAGLLGSVASDVSQRGDDILGMLKAGRGGEVTDKMLDMGDNVKNTQLNQYLYQNYDLPMDEASRMARAREMGLTDDQYHATKANFANFLPSKTGLSGRGVYAGDYPEEVLDYAIEGQGRDNLSLIPIRTPSSEAYARNIDWQRTIDADEQFPYDANLEQTVAGFKRAADTMTEQGYAGVHNQAGERVTFEPKNTRSRFARFDPRLAHLSNLTAANASPIGGLLAQGMIPQEELENYLKRGLLD